MIGCNQIKDIAWDMSSKFMDRDCPPPNLSMLVSRVVLLVMMLAGEAGLFKRCRCTRFGIFYNLFLSVIRRNLDF